MSVYDNYEKAKEDDKEDNDALNQLEWELASEQGLIDGNNLLTRARFINILLKLSYFT